MKNENALKFVDNIQAGLCENMKGIKAVDRKVDSILDMLRNFYSLGIPSYVPDLSGKQIFKMVRLGWTIDQLRAISGYSEEEIQKKYQQHVKNNIGR